MNYEWTWALACGIIVLVVDISILIWYKRRYE
mgnify:CR=1 FL=1